MCECEYADALIRAIAPIFFFVVVVASALEHSWLDAMVPPPCRVLGFAVRGAPTATLWTRWNPSMDIPALPLPAAVEERSGREGRTCVLLATIGADASMDWTYCTTSSESPSSPPSGSRQVPLAGVCQQPDASGGDDVVLARCRIQWPLYFHPDLASPTAPAAARAASIAAATSALRAALTQPKRGSSGRLLATAAKVWLVTPDAPDGEEAGMAATDVPAKTSSARSAKGNKQPPPPAFRASSCATVGDVWMQTSSGDGTAGASGASVAAAVSGRRPVLRPAAAAGGGKPLPASHELAPVTLEVTLMATPAADQGEHLPTAAFTADTAGSFVAVTLHLDAIVPCPVSLPLRALDTQLRTALACQLGYMSAWLSSSALPAWPALLMACPVLLPSASWSLTSFPMLTPTYPVPIRPAAGTPPATGTWADESWPGALAERSAVHAAFELPLQPRVMRRIHEMGGVAWR